MMIVPMQLTIFGSISVANAAYFYPNAQASVLEHILVDTHGAFSSGFADAITPCTNYVSGNQSMGRETAAQWIRVAFHDFVTAHVAEGTGGMDASIGFETLREENSGTAFNDSFLFWRSYVNPKVSMADLVAMGTVMSTGNCGGVQIPVRGGRIDATEGGASGVPAPDTDLATTLSYFAGAGFNQVDSIGLTACGHTMGSVHHGGFPTVVGPDAVTSNNLAGGVHLDSTVDVFDPLVVHEYVNGTGQQGGPLVTSFNVSSRSDLRLYESDNNATMIALANQGPGFLSTCVTLLQRMIETVPAGVALSPVVKPQTVKPINATLDFDPQGNLIFSGYIRTLTPIGKTAPASTPLILTTSSSVEPTVLTAQISGGNNIFGTTLFFPFSTKISDPSFFHSFTVLGESIPISTFQVQSNSFVVPSLTSITYSTTSTAVNFTVAVMNGGRYSRRGSSAPSVKVSAPLPQMGTLGPAISSLDNVAVTNAGAKAGYSLWEGSAEFGAMATGAVSVEIMSGSETVDLLFVGND